MSRDETSPSRTLAPFRHPLVSLLKKVKGALAAMMDIKRWSLQKKHLTVSTVGVVHNLKRLTEDCPGVSLALSLHAPNQTVRELIVPTAKAHPLPELLAALDAHLDRCVWGG